MAEVNEQRLVDTFIELVQINSETKDEKAIQHFLKRQFQELGLKVTEDDTIGETGCAANNLFCVLEGDTGYKPVFFSSHMDTVVPGNKVQPKIRDGIIYSDGTTILGADDKAGLAVMIELVKVLKETGTRHGKIEFVLTVGEESGLIGAKAFDTTYMESDIGFVLDTGGPVGSIMMGSPTQYRIEALIHGVSAHAGLEPEKGYLRFKSLPKLSGK